MIFVSLSVFSFAIFWARKSRPVKNRQGKELNQRLCGTEKEISKVSTFTVTTFNVQTGKNLHGKRDIRRAADAIKESQLVGIQELYAPTYLSRLKLCLSQIQTLSNAGGFDWLFCATRRRWLREHRGNAILSKLPVTDWKIQALPDHTGKRFRNMTIVKAHWQGQSFHFINTHLHTRTGKDEQLEAVLNEFSKYSKVILVGDFNSTPSNPRLIELLKDKNILDPLKLFDLDLNKDKRVDWILSKGFKVHDVKVIEKGISDHPCYKASFSF